MTPRVPGTKPRSEAAIQAAILTFLDTRGDVVAWRANSRVVMMPGKAGRRRPVRFGFKGQPDIIGYYVLRPERPALRVAVFLAIEVKAAGKEHDLSREQAAFLARVRADGGIAIVASCVAHVAAALC